MPFNRQEVALLLVRCHRRCCICHRFCGTKIETDHIVPAAESADHAIENAIPVCFDCHAEIHAYNPSHPRGRRFTPDELRAHKEQWLQICETRPEIFVEAARQVDIGPLQGLLDELDHNLVISSKLDFSTLGFQFRDTQMERAIREGVISILDDDLSTAIHSAYGMISLANESSRAWLNSRALHGTDGLTMDAVQRNRSFGRHEIDSFSSSRVSRTKVSDPKVTTLRCQLIGTDHHRGLSATNEANSPSLPRTCPPRSLLALDPRSTEARSALQTLPRPESPALG